MTFGCDSSGDYVDKSELDSSCLATYGNTSETRTQMDFSSSMEYTGVSADQMKYDFAAQDAALTATAQSMSGVTKENIGIESITDSARRVLSSAFNIQPTAVGCTITFNVRTFLEDMGFTPYQSEEAFAQLTEQLTDSVISGNYMQFMKQSYSQNPSQNNTLDSLGDISSPTYTEYTVTVIRTASPTTIPTFVPTSFSAAKSESGYLLTDGAVAGIALAGVVVFVGAGALLYFFVISRSGKSLEADFRSKTKNTRDAPDAKLVELADLKFTSGDEEEDIRTSDML